MAIDAIGSISASASTARIDGATPAGKTAFDQILDAFKKEAAKTPAERARDAILKKHGLTDDTYAALPTDQKKAIEAEVVQAAARAMGADGGGSKAATASSGASFA